MNTQDRSITGLVTDNKILYLTEDSLFIPPFPPGLYLMKTIVSDIILQENWATLIFPGSKKIYSAENNTRISAFTEMSMRVPRKDIVTFFEVSLSEIRVFKP